MTPDIVKIIAVVSGIFLFLRFYLFGGNRHLTIVALYFTSVAVFSQNFYLFFREVHQFIQILIILLTIPTLFTKLYSFNRFLIIFGFFIGISFIINPYDDDAHSQVINYGVIMFILNYLYLKIQKVDDLFVIFKYIGRLSILLSVLGVFEYIIFATDRIEVSFANPNYLGLFLSVGFCFVQKNPYRFERYLGSIFILIAIILTGSRSVLIIPLFYIFWIGFIKYGFIKSIIYFIVSLALVFAIVSSGLTRFTDSDAAQASDAERLAFGRVALNMALDHPYTGVGWGRFISEFQNYSTKVDEIIIRSGNVDISKQDRRVTHNDLLRILSELGFAAFLFSIFFIIKTSIILPKFKVNYCICIPPVWLGLIFFSMSHNNLNTAYTWFFLLLPLIAYRRNWLV